MTGKYSNVLCSTFLAVKKQTVLLFVPNESAYAAVILCYTPSYKCWCVENLHEASGFRGYNETSINVQWLVQSSG